MPYRIAADLVMLLHFAFLAFAVLGGFLLHWWPGVVWWHLPVLAWGVSIALIGGTCPLTPLENRLRVAGGGRAYEGGFIEYYLLGRLYPAGLPRPLMMALGALLLLVNLLPYGFWLCGLL